MRKNILTIAAIIVASVSVLSQSVTETRQIKTTALQMYEKYKVEMSGLHSRSAYTEDNFMALFDDNAVLYNDIIPANMPVQLSPAEYFAKFQESVRRIYPAFSEFKMGEPVSVGRKWQIKCNFTRAAKFRTQKDMRYPEWFFNYTMTIEMDKRYNQTNKVYENARIVSVDVENPLRNFFIIENKEDIPLITKSGETLTGWDAEYQSRIFPENEWTIKDIQISESNKNIFEYSKGRFSKNKTDANFYKPDVQRFPKDIFGVGVNCGLLALGNKMSEDFKNIQQTNTALSLSLFYGKQVFRKEKATGFVNFGLDINRYSYGYSLKNNSVYKYPNLLKDSDGDDYQRIIKVNLLNDIHFIVVSVPVSFEYVRQVTEQAKNPFFLSFELGVFAECTLSSSSKFILNADRSGFYEQYFDDKVPPFDHYYDYGNFGEILF